jgi:hypothetical protein
MKGAINELLIVVWMLIPAIPALLYGDNASLQSQNIRAYDSAEQATSATLGLLRITPEGNDVPAVRQIVFQFDRPVVPIGRMERDAAEIAIDISPEVHCQWCWINTRALACQLDKANALQPETRYWNVKTDLIFSSFSRHIRKIDAKAKNSDKLRDGINGYINVIMQV